RERQEPSAALVASRKPRYQPQNCNRQRVGAISTMRTFVIAATMLLGASVADAACIGTDSFSTCTDASGNSYTVNRFGNQTIMNGYSASTGSTWSQQTTTLGNMTMHNGMTNGSPWHETEMNFGNGHRSIYGTDSDGESFSYHCSP